MSPPVRPPGSYSFAKVLITLEPEQAERVLSRKTDGVYDLYVAPSPELGLLMHEYCHFVQAMTTVMGQNLLLNMFSVMGSYAKELSMRDTIKIPIKPPHPGVVDKINLSLVSAWDSAIDQMKDLVGCQFAYIREGSVLKGLSGYMIGSFPYVNPYDQKPQQQRFITIPTRRGEIIGVPLLGDAFFEGMSQAVQLYRESISREALERRIKALVLNDNYYYAATIEYSMRLQKKADPLLTAIVLCDAALCSEKTSTVFTAACSYLTARIRGGNIPTSIADFIKLRNELTNEIKELKESLVNQHERLGNLIRDQEAHSTLISTDLLALLRPMQDAIRSRLEGETNYLPILPPINYLRDITAKLGSPPVHINGKQQISMDYDLPAQKAFTDACLRVHALYELLEYLTLKQSKGPCEFLSQGVCGFQKAASCTDGDLLSPPTVGGTTCIIGAAGINLGVSGK